MSIYMNMDCKVRNGGRKAPAMTKEQLIELLKAAFYAYPESDNLNPEFYGGFTCYPSLAGYKDREDDLNTNELKDIRTRLNVWSKVLDDFKKVFVDFENFQVIEIVTSDSGISAVYCAFGGDWECPVAGYIDFDGNNFRGYIPTFRNVFNAHGKVAIGSEEETTR